MSAFDLYHRWWMKRGDRRAWQDPTWAAIQEKRDAASKGTSGTVMFSEKDGLGSKEWDVQQEIWFRLSPHTLVHRSRWALQKYGPRSLRRKAATALQRAKRGYSETDVWNLNTHLSRVISGSIEELRQERHGHPASLTDEQWDSILKEISEGFASAEAADDILLSEEERDAAKAKLDRAYDLLKQWHSSLWD